MQRTASSRTLNQSINRKKKRRGLGFARRWIGALLVGAVSLASASAGASELEPDPNRRVVFLRPHAGVGWASAYNRSGNALALHAGGRLLFPAPLSPTIDAKFGIEATYVQLDITANEIFTERYAAVGVVLEMTVVGGFNLGIGTLGYVGVAGTDRNPFGVVTNLGWEPTWNTRARPSITMRTEWIFDVATYNVLSLSVGVTFGV